MALLVLAANSFLYAYHLELNRQQLRAELAQFPTTIEKNRELWLDFQPTQAIAVDPQSVDPVITRQNQLYLLASPVQGADQYKSLELDGVTYHLAAGILLKSSLFGYLIINLLVLLPLLIAWRLQSIAHKQQQDLEIISNNINELMVNSQLPIFATAQATDKLALLGHTLQTQQKRQQEIRHLVRVQGLIDHDLAIGNRIYFESKLQHYLTEPNEPAIGTVFLLQVTEPEGIDCQSTILQRMTGCVELLTQLTNHLPQTILGRVAEHDFALLIPGLAQKEAIDLGDRMAMVLSKSSYFHGLADQDVLHIGYVIYQHGQSSYQVLAEADMALKTAQLQGPNAAYGFYPSEKPKIKGSVWWRTELTNALREQRFMLSFQPVFSSIQHDIIQHEVLVRLQSSEGDKLSAAIFLPMAANCGLTAKIDEYVVLKTAKLCQMDQLGDARCSINLSVATLLNAEWWSWLEQMVKTAAITPQQFSFEIDEYYVLRQYKVLKPKLLKLGQLGFSLIIDHVGLLIEACPYMSELSIEAIKLHPSVIRDIDKQLEQQLYIRGLLASNTQQQARVIASGVETLAEWQTLQKLGISAAQGFYFSQPLAELMAHDQTV